MSCRLSIAMPHSDPLSSRPALDRALEASARGEAAAAVELFLQAIAEQPDSEGAHFLLGSEYAALGDIAQAERHITTALLLRPQWHVARYQLGLLQFSDGRVPAALLTWQPLASLEESSPLPHWVHGFAALARNDFGAARPLFEAGLARNTEHPPMSADIQRVLAAMPGAEPTAETEGDGVAHVLLSNYQQAGHVH
jgi:tetratricopeptide (TPR) repeat protein